MKSESPTIKAPQITRPPVVAVMGHIDHGKSTLLDYIRKTNVAAGEAGGITQHIGAYEVEHTSGDKIRKITFLDTPGHEAFQGIRERGARVADIAILVVSAEDGVKTQTLQALQTIKDAKIPYLVALTKIDKPNANIELAKQSLAEHEIYIEGYGGDIPCVPVSSKTGTGIPDLLEMIVLLADMGEITADPHLPASGIIVEANRDMKKGIAATLIIQNGTLSKNMYVVAGASFSPIRLMENFRGEKVETVTFSSPVKVIGWNTLPEVGSAFTTFNTKKEAEAAAEQNAEKMKQKKTIAANGTESSEKPSIPLILKADAVGSLEALFHEINKLPQDKVSIKIIQSGIGNIGEGDIKAATGSEGTFVVGFSTKIDPQAENLAERSSVPIKIFSIIYELGEWLSKLITARTPRIKVEESRGKAKILKTFSRTKDRQILGGKVEAGVIRVGSEIKILRREAEIGRGKVRGLQQKKEKTAEIAEGYEFGADIESKNEIAAGDRIECFEVVEKSQ